VKDIYFDYDKYEIRPDQQVALQGDAKFLQQHANIRITVEGHSDERGSTEYNLALSANRADTVKNALIQAGVGGDRVKTSATAKKTVLQRVQRKLLAAESPRTLRLREIGTAVEGRASAPVLTLLRKERPFDIQ